MANVDVTCINGVTYYNYPSPVSPPLSPSTPPLSPISPSLKQYKTLDFDGNPFTLLAQKKINDHVFILPNGSVYSAPPQTHQLPATKEPEQQSMPIDNNAHLLNVIDYNMKRNMPNTISHAVDLWRIYLAALRSLGVETLHKVLLEHLEILGSSHPEYPSLLNLAFTVTEDAPEALSKVLQSVINSIEQQNGAVEGVSVQGLLEKVMDLGERLDIYNAVVAVKLIALLPQEERCRAWSNLFIVAFEAKSHDATLLLCDKFLEAVREEGNDFYSDSSSVWMSWRGAIRCMHTLPLNLLCSAKLLPVPLSDEKIKPHARDFLKLYARVIVNSSLSSNRLNMLLSEMMRLRNMVGLLSEAESIELIRSVDITLLAKTVHKQSRERVNQSAELFGNILMLGSKESMSSKMKEFVRSFIANISSNDNLSSEDLAGIVPIINEWTRFCSWEEKFTFVAALTQNPEKPPLLKMALDLTEQIVNEKQPHKREHKTLVIQSCQAFVNHCDNPADLIQAGKLISKRALKQRTMSKQISAMWGPLLGRLLQMVTDEDAVKNDPQGVVLEALDFVLQNMSSIAPQKQKAMKMIPMLCEGTILVLRYHGVSAAKAFLKKLRSNLDRKACAVGVPQILSAMLESFTTSPETIRSNWKTFHDYCLKFLKTRIASGEQKSLILSQVLDLLNLPRNKLPAAYATDLCDYLEHVDIEAWVQKGLFTDEMQKTVISLVGEPMISMLFQKFIGRLAIAYCDAGNFEKAAEVLYQISTTILYPLQDANFFLAWRNIVSALLEYVLQPEHSGLSTLSQDHVRMLNKTSLFANLESITKLPGWHERLTPEEVVEDTTELVHLICRNNDEKICLLASAMVFKVEQYIDFENPSLWLPLYQVLHDKLRCYPFPGALRSEVENLPGVHTMVLDHEQVLLRKKGSCESCRKNCDYILTAHRRVLSESCDEGGVLFSQAVMQLNYLKTIYEKKVYENDSNAYIQHLIELLKVFNDRESVYEGQDYHAIIKLFLTNFIKMLTSDKEREILFSKLIAVVGEIDLSLLGKTGVSLSDAVHECAASSSSSGKEGNS